MTIQELYNKYIETNNSLDFKRLKKATDIKIMSNIYKANIRNRVDVEDLLQQCWYQFFYYNTYNKDKSLFITYISTILRNVINRWLEWKYKYGKTYPIELVI